MIKWFSAFIFSILVHVLIYLTYIFLDSTQEVEAEKKITNVNFIQSEEKEIKTNTSSKKAEIEPVSTLSQQENKDPIQEPTKETVIENLDEYLKMEQQQDISKKKLDKVEQISLQVIKDIEGIWVRPNSLKKGMYADFSLRIDRSGTIKEVNIMRTSGNDTFDRAAMNAIKKYKKIKGMDKIDEETYRIYFANFTLRFNPDD
tara:strand:+ start:1093 stop:1698 length:606 start_codon:yes stop_codon:yes gene_type:complete